MTKIVMLKWKTTTTKIVALKWKMRMNLKLRLKVLGLEREHQYPNLQGKLQMHGDRLNLFIVVFYFHYYNFNKNITRSFFVQLFNCSGLGVSYKCFVNTFLEMPSCPVYSFLTDKNG